MSMTFLKTWTVFKKAIDGLFTSQAPVVIPSDASGQIAAATPAARFTATSRIYTGGVTVQNLDTTNGAWIGASNTNGSGSTSGWYLAPAGGAGQSSISLPPCDVSTLYAYNASATPSINWFGVDLA